MDGVDRWLAREELVAEQLGEVPAEGTWPSGRPALREPQGADGRVYELLYHSPEPRGERLGAVLARLGRPDVAVGNVRYWCGRDLIVGAVAAGRHVAWMSVTAVGAPAFVRVHPIELRAPAPPERGGTTFHVVNAVPVGPDRERERVSIGPGPGWSLSCTPSARGLVSFAVGAECCARTAERPVEATCVVGEHAFVARLADQADPAAWGWSAIVPSVGPRRALGLCDDSAGQEALRAELRAELRAPEPEPPPVRTTWQVGFRLDCDGVPSTLVASLTTTALDWPGEEIPDVLDEASLGVECDQGRRHLNVNAAVLVPADFPRSVRYDDGPFEPASTRYAELPPEHLERIAAAERVEVRWTLDTSSEVTATFDLAAAGDGIEDVLAACPAP